MLALIRAVHWGVLAGLGFLAGAAFAVLAVLITIDILLRNFGVVSFPWLLEVSEYVLYFATLLAAPWVLRQGAHVRVDLLLLILRPSWSRVVEVVADLLGLAGSAVLAWHGWRITADAFLRGDIVIKELVVPEWPILAAIPVAGILLTFEFMRRLWLRPMGRSVDVDRGQKPLTEGF